MSSAAQPSRPSPNSADNNSALGGVATRFKSWAAAQRVGEDARKPVDSVRELSYEEALRTHTRFQPAQMPVARPVHPPAQPTTQPAAPRKQEDGSLTRSAESANSFENVIQAQIQRLSKADPELVARWLAEHSPAPDACTPTDAEDLSVQMDARSAVNPVLFAFTATQSQQPLPELQDVSPLVFAEDDREEEFGFAEQLEREEAPREVPLQSPFQQAPQRLLRFQRYAQINNKMLALTVRLTPEDCDAVRLHACEAGLSISAYLRACALEVEELRTEVKQMIAAARPLRPSQSSQSPQSQPRQPGLLATLLSRIFPLRA